MFFIIDTLKDFASLKDTLTDFWISQKQPVVEVLRKVLFLPADVNKLKDFLVLEEKPKMLE